jgi:DNA-binding MarR family transcriptional regulator
VPTPDVHQRFDYLVHDIARLNGRRFDRLAREQLGLSRAQVRLLGTLDLHGGNGGMTQNALADFLDMTPMAVAALCARLESAGWISRVECAEDRRAKRVRLEPAAHAPLAKALKLADRLQADCLAPMNATERAQLTALLQRVHARLQRGREDG